MLKSLEVTNFTAFGTASLKFAKGLNVFVGENGTGKTHLLKLPHAVMATSASEGRIGEGAKPVKGALQRDIARKLIQIFRPESLGRLTRRQQGRNRCEVKLQFDHAQHAIGFSFASQNTTEVSLDPCPEEWIGKAPVFLPSHELLTIYPGFVPVYDNHHLQFDETWRDTRLLLGAAPLKGPREQRAASLLKPLEELMGGRVILDPNGRFYLKLPGIGNLEAHLVAEGLRKLALVARLIATGSLLDQGCLFWDEPESNLNPKLVRGVAEAILGICSEGIQVFVATHSLFLLRELEILLEQHQFKAIEQRYFALAPGDEGVEIQQGDRIDDVDPLVALDEELRQSDDFLNSAEEVTT